MLNCLDKTCTFHVRVHQSKKDGAVTLTVYRPHICHVHTHYDFRGTKLVKFLKDEHRTAILSDRTMTPESIKKEELRENGNDIEYMQAYRIKRAVLFEADGPEEDAFPLFPALLARIEELSAKQTTPHHVAYKQHPTTHAFEAFAVAPGPTRAAFTYLRRFVALDGTHTRGKFPMTLLAATTLDGNSNIVLLAFALVPIENKEYWTWFLHFMSEAFDMSGINSDEEPVVFISDADKGLKVALETEFPASCHAMCVWHLSENVRLKHGSAQAAAFVFPLAKAKTKAAYSGLIEQLRAVPGGPKAIEYLEKQEKERWVRCYFPLPQFGHTTSNIAESLNSVLRAIRGLPPLKMIDAIWHYIMTTWYKRKVSKHRGFLPNAALDNFERRLRTGSRFTLSQSNDLVWQVENLKRNRFVVNMEEGERGCECTDPEEYEGACSHMLAVIKDHGMDPRNYIDRPWTIEAYRLVYRESLHPLSIASLMRDPDTTVPAFRTQKGRPKTKRFRNEAWGMKKRRCGKCRKLCRHTKRICPYPAALSVAVAEDSGDDHVEIDDDIWDENDLDWQLEQEMDMAAAWAATYAAVEQENIGRGSGELSTSPRSSLLDPFEQVDSQIDDVEPLSLPDNVDAPAKIKHSFYYVIADSPEPEPVRSRTRARTQAQQGLGSNS